jgi:hypothetical protein
MPSLPYGPATPLLIGYDPAVDLPSDHLARFVDTVVEAAVPSGYRCADRGRPSYDLRLCLKVLLYGYSTGVRSSRQLERLCHEHLAYLYLTRGAAPSYRTLCAVRVSHKALMETVWVSLFNIAGEYGIARLGRIVVDSSKFRADASREMILDKDEYAPMLAELQRILTEAEQADKREEDEGGGSGTRLGRDVSSDQASGDQMRDIVRRVRSSLARQKKARAAAADRADSHQEDGHQEDGHSQDHGTQEGQSPGLTQRMLQRIVESIAALEEAGEEQRKHLCLTDPDARMMPEGIHKGIRECYSFEVAVDAGLLVAGQTTQDGFDQQRLEPLVAAAAEHEPGGIGAVDADSGYFRSDSVAGLISAGIDTCIPDPHTACDLHRGDPIGSTRGRAFSKVPMTYIEDQNQYTCPEGNVLRFWKTKKDNGQTIRIYIAERDCTGCPLAGRCLTQAKAVRRQLSVGCDNELLKKARQRFEQPEHQARYHNRNPAVESVFGFLRSVLGYTRWSLRGKEKIACEGALFKLAYQVRKITSARQNAASTAIMVA